MTREEKRLYDASRYLRKKKEILEKQAAWRASNQELARKRATQYNLSWRKRNPDKWASFSELWRARNPGYKARWNRENRHKAAVYERARDAVEKRASPRWRNLFFIQEIYELARLRTQLTGVPHHVDHIVPLRHPLVCGLHVEQNLRVIPAVANMAKGNRFWEGMP